MSAGDRTKLPQWAQREIEALERSRDHWMAQATESPEDSDTFVLLGYDGTTPQKRGLGMFATVEFHLPDGERVEVRNTGEMVEVRAAGASANPLAVYPSASNVIKVGTKPWRE